MPRLSPKLLGTPKEQADILMAAKSVADVADALEVNSKDLIYILYRAKDRYAYRSFEIPKRNGGTRSIQAPHPTVKILQQKLARILTEIYEPTRSAHGYVKGRSIVTNARRHEGKRWVLNVDLKDFFPSINFGRVRGLFINRYGIDPAAATVMAQLCTTGNALPQGAPTSPIISNMICSGLDHDLHSLATEHNCWYTRYADDLTISTRLPEMPTAIGYRDESSEGKPAKVGRELAAIIGGQGFRVNDSKVWLKSSARRQRVTGLTVNRGVNVPRRHIRRIRAMLYTYENEGIRVLRQKTKKTYSPASKYDHAPIPDATQVVRGTIEYLGMVRGRDDPLYRAYLTRFLDLESRRFARRRPRSNGAV